MPAITPRDTTVAVVGAGPAGISVARELAVAGHQVTVFDELPYGGGTMLIGVPAFRLPREAIEMDFRLVERLGVALPLSASVSGATSPSSSCMEQLRRRRHLRRCHGRGRRWTCPGGDLDGIQYGVDFMKKANLGEPLEVGNDVVVIGGGYTAMDCSRTSLRYGAENVTIAYRRTRSELVVDEEELGETEREGVRMEFLVSPIEVLGDDEGKVARRQVRAQPAGRAGRDRPARPGARSRAREFDDPGGHGHPGRQPGGGQHVPAGRVELRDQPRPCPRRPGHVRHQRPWRLRLRRLRDRPDDAHRGGRPRQEVRLRHRSLPVGPARGRCRRQRAHRQLVAPRDARVLRRPAARRTCPWRRSRRACRRRDPHGQLHDAGGARLHDRAGHHRGRRAA